MRAEFFFTLWLGCGLAASSSAQTASPIPSRQVHLDFHTSEFIPDVGGRFSKTNWQEALRLGRVNWINVFAKCHHGWSYYPTKVGRVHPALKIDLLGQQLAACKEMGVRCPVYYTVGWSASDAEAHPEWRVKNRDGTYAARSVDFHAKPEDPRPGTSWIFLCPTGEYLDLILRQTEEICRMYDVDGFFYDIDHVSPPCFCERCRQGMAAEGLSEDDTNAAAAYTARTWKHFFTEARQVIAKHRPSATVFFNGTTKLQPHCLNHQMWEHNTQMELEDLPTTWGGYDKFPLRSKFFHNIGKPVFAMTGKFHTSWGEFGGFKNPDALRYEVAAMIAYGASCNIGDQLHPSGEMDLETYRGIGKAYEYAQKIESYGVGGRPVSKLGLWPSGSTADDEGVSVMLMETHNDFVVVGPQTDLSRIEVLVLTGGSGLDEADARHIRQFVGGGGKLLVLGESAMGKGTNGFVLDVGARYLGPANYTEDYLVVGPELSGSMVTAPILDYRAALRAEPLPGAQVLAALREPYFNRTYAKYSSHLNTPYKLTNAPHAAAIQSGSTIFLPHRLGEMYYTNGALMHRQFFANALERLYDKPMVKATLPSCARLTLLHQPDQKRYVTHLLYGPPVQRGRCLVIEDLPELRNIELEARLPGTVTQVYAVPSGKKLAMKRRGDAALVSVPPFNTHCAIVFDYAD